MRSAAVRQARQWTSTAQPSSVWANASWAATVPRLARSRSAIVHSQGRHRDIVRITIQASTAPTGPAKWSGPHGYRRPPPRARPHRVRRHRARASATWPTAACRSRACVATLARALDAGLNVIDTAPNYEDGYSARRSSARPCAARRDARLRDRQDRPPARRRSARRSTAQPRRGSARRTPTRSCSTACPTAATCASALASPAAASTSSADASTPAASAVPRHLVAPPRRAARRRSTTGVATCVMFPVGPFVDRALCRRDPAAGASRWASARSASRRSARASCSATRAATTSRCSSGRAASVELGGATTRDAALPRLTRRGVPALHADARPRRGAAGPQLPERAGRRVRRRPDLPPARRATQMAVRARRAPRRHARQGRRLVEPARAAAVRYRSYAPAPVLRPFVRTLWSLEGDDPAPAADRIFPDGCMELVFHLGTPFSAWDDDGCEAQQPAAFLVGQMTRALRVRPSRRAAVVGVRFHPGGAFPFLRMPQHELHGRLPALADVSPALARMAERLHDARDLDAAVAAVAGAARGAGRLLRPARPPRGRVRVGDRGAARAPSRSTTSRGAAGSARASWSGSSATRSAWRPRRSRASRASRPPCAPARAARRSPRPGSPRATPTRRTSRASSAGWRASRPPRSLAERAPLASAFADVGFVQDAAAGAA